MGRAGCIKVSGGRCARTSNDCGSTDYYVRECGTWAGKGAERLGLAGQVRREDFMALANNKVPGTDERLTVRRKEDRRTGYDFCFAVPKSVSLYLAETGDKAVEQMILEAFNETMTDVEARMETRVRIGGPDRDRTTGNMVYASFIHTTGRPIEGICDPHWHIHAFTFNATFDPQEKRWKAGQFGNIKADAPFYEAAFNNYLAGKLVAAGYGVRRTDKHFELASVSRELIEKFSKRTRLVEQFIRENHTALYAKARALVKKTGMEFADAFAHVKSEIGARTRKKKTENKLTAEEQLVSWRSQMTPAERVSLQKEVVKGIPNENLLDPELAKELAIKHLYERASVARALHAAGMLLRRGLGRVTVDQAKAFAQHDKRFIRPDFAGKLVTTREVLEEEKAMIELASAGRGAYASLGNGSEWQCAEGISDEQARVVEHLLKSKDAARRAPGRRP